MSQTRKQMPPMIPPRKRDKDETFGFLRESTITRPTPPYQAKPKLGTPRAIVPKNPSQGAVGSSQSVEHRSMAPIKPSRSMAHLSPSASHRTMGPPPPPRGVASPPAHQSRISMARAEPSRSTPSRERTYLREKASSKQSSRDTACPPRHVRPSHETATNKPSKSATPQPLPLDPNLFLAGKLAHEYLKKGTLFGEPYVPTEANFPPASSSAGSTTDVGTTNKPSESNASKEKSSKVEQQSVNNLRYASISKKLMSRAMHIPGIVNPSQLADFLKRHPEVE